MGYGGSWRKEDGAGAGKRWGEETLVVFSCSEGFGKVDIGEDKVAGGLIWISLSLSLSLSYLHDILSLPISLCAKTRTRNESSPARTASVPLVHLDPQPVHSSASDRSLALSLIFRGVVWSCPVMPES